ncbi:MAG: hypothetical protein BWY82_02908 [Verrucomicrobia bacterium ADurb.Bin474]|nr:MAG: hypothetical protein BWY82_02908 [Verrucomicrobia bacterium ADurb.Bin474]
MDGPSNKDPTRVAVDKSRIPGFTPLPHTYSMGYWGERDNAAAMACSRAPDPTINIFLLITWVSMDGFQGQ